MKKMRIILLICTVLMTVHLSFSQTAKNLTDLESQNNVIRNETVAGANTKGRIADMYKSVYLSSPNLFASYSNPSWISSLAWSKITGAPDFGALYAPLSFKTNLDALSGILKSNGSGVYSVITDNSSNWNTAFGWGNHAGLYGSLTLDNVWIGNNAFRNDTRQETGTAYTLQSTDEGLTIEFTNSSPITVTLPNGLAQYFSCSLIKKGTGNITITATGTLESSGNTIVTQHTGAFVEQKGSNVWNAFGSLGTNDLESLSDVTITSNTSGEILKWNGTAWINNTLAEAGIQPAGTYATGAGSASGANTDDVTLSGTPDYITISGQVITRGLIDQATDVTGLLPVSNGGTGTATPALVAGTNVTITGTWPNQTINATGGGGGLTYAQVKAIGFKK